MNEVNSVCQLLFSQRLIKRLHDFGCRYGCWFQLLVQPSPVGNWWTGARHIGWLSHSLRPPCRRDASRRAAPLKLASPQSGSIILPQAILFVSVLPGIGACPARSRVPDSCPAIVNHKNHGKEHKMAGAARPVCRCRFPCRQRGGPVNVLQHARGGGCKPAAMCCTRGRRERDDMVL